MTKFIIQGGLRIEEDFWAHHAPLLHNEYFAKLKETYEDSSRIMWAIVMDYEKAEYNPYCRMNNDMKLDALKSYCPTYDRDNRLIAKVTQVFLSMFETEAKRSYRTHEDDMANRTWVMKKLTAWVRDKIEEDPSCIGDKAVISAMTTLENMRKNTDTVFKKFATVAREFMDDEAQRSRLMGGGELSLTEDGGLIDIDDEEMDAEYQYSPGDPSPVDEPKEATVTQDESESSLYVEQETDYFKWKLKDEVPWDDEGSDMFDGEEVNIQIKKDGAEHFDQ